MFFKLKFKGNESYCSYCEKWKREETKIAEVFNEIGNFKGYGQCCNLCFRKYQKRKAIHESEEYIL